VLVSVQPQEPAPLPAPVLPQLAPVPVRAALQV